MPAQPPTSLEADDAGNVRLIVRTARQRRGRHDLGVHVTRIWDRCVRLSRHLMRDWIALEDLHYRDSGDAADSHDDRRRDLEFGYRQDTRVTL